MTSKIIDQDVRNAIEALINEFEFKEQTTYELEKQVFHLENVVEDYESRVSYLEEKVKSLEEALAEAYLITKEQETI